VSDEQVTPDNQSSGPEGEGDAAAKSWYETLPDALRSEKSLTKFKAPADVAQAYVNLERMLGSRVPLPSEKSTPEEIAEFRRKIGVPEKHDEYGEYQLPEGANPWDRDSEKSFLKKAHEAGMTKVQVDALRGWYTEWATGIVQQDQAGNAARLAKGFEQIKQEWGPLTQRNLGLVSRVVGDYGDPDLKTMLDGELALANGEKLSVGNHPAFLKFIHRIANDLAEDGLIKTDNLGMGSNDAKAEISKLMNTAEYRAGDAAVVGKVRELFQIAYPS